MNRNVESYFATTAHAGIQRSLFDRSQDIKFSFDTGVLIPFFWDEVLPGDTFSITTSKVVRLQTLLTPIMDNIYLDTYFFFVPYRLVWDHWKEFMGENTQSAWLPEVTYSIPQIRPQCMQTGYSGTETGFNVHSIVDYLGVPVDKAFEISALPVRAYELIWNEWFRDENLQDPINTYKGDATTYLADNDKTVGPATNNKKIGCYNVAKYHDYFTSCLPAPLKGDPVTAPVTGASVLAGGTELSGLMPTYSLKWDHGGYFGANTRALRGEGVNSAGSGQVMRKVSGTGIEGSTETVNLFGTTSSLDALAGFYPTNLWTATDRLGVNIMQLRNAFQVQKLLERDARAGTRYTEIIKGHFNVTSPDSRLQRPEYLGGNRVPITIHQITNQSQGEQDFLGDLGAMSLTTDKHFDFQQSFTEHGCIIGVMCARYDHSYPQGLERAWSRKTRFDFYWPEFAHLSEQAVLNKEIFTQGTSEDEEVFGYQEAWADMRYKPNRVAGEMRPGIPNTLASWHLADHYASLPHLSADWIREDSTQVDRVLAVTSEIADQIFCDVYVKNMTTRPMPIRSIPGLADHF